MKIPDIALIVLALIASSAVVVFSAETDLPGIDGKKVRVAGAEAIQEEKDEEERIAKEKRRQTADAEKRDLVLKQELDLKHKYDDARASLQSATERFESVAKLKKRFNTTITVNTNEIDYSNKKIANWNVELQNLSDSVRFPISGGGASVNISFAAERKAIADRIAAEEKRKQTASSKIAEARTQLTLLNSEYASAFNARQSAENELRAAKLPAPVAAPAKPKGPMRRIYSLIDGRELIVIMAVEDDTDVRLITADGKQFHFLRTFVAGSRNEGKE